MCFIPDYIGVVLEGRYFRIFIAYSFPMIGHTQMPRKFCLGRMCKNVERKRQKARQAQGTNKIGRPSKKVSHNDNNFYQHGIMQCVFSQVDIRDLRTGICLPSQWVDQTASSNNNLVACKLQHTDGQSVTVTRSVTVNNDLTWCVHVHGQVLDPSKCSALKN